MIKYIQCHVTAVVLLSLLSSTSHAQSLPKSITRQLPTAYTVLTFTSADFNADGRADYIVVVHKKNEKAMTESGEPTPRRPLLAFIQRENITFTLIARNDSVVYAIDEGGQCDPFLDGEDGLAAKGAFFTVQNSVACGNHWTDYLTFRYSPEQKNFIFHKRIFENWIMNTSNTPNADALVLENRSVTSAKKARPILLRDYQPNP